MPHQLSALIQLGAQMAYLPSMCNKKEKSNNIELLLTEIIILTVLTLYGTEIMDVLTVRQKP
jgi:heme/copper-type cytochrome/quinol oxidase subunit 4